tara:strand:+ start:1791 stop:2753 length:963 start_codon:yes stop_codon:yes gene_type:complete
MANIFKYTYNVLFLNNWEENIYFRHLLIISFAIIVYYVFKKYVDDTDEIYKLEGFSQMHPYVFKRNNDCYDDFYLEMFDTIYDNYKRIPLEIENIVKNTEINEKSKILVLNPNTGLMINEFVKYNYNCCGLESSKDVINYSKQIYPEIFIEHGNLFDPLVVNNNSFSHIIMNNYNLYRYENKLSLLKNCYYWLQSNGYLILHVIDPLTFDTIMPVAKPCLYNNIHNKLNKRIKKCNVKFLGFNYYSEYIFKNKNNLLLKEKFVDKKTNNTREQEQTFYLEKKEIIEEYAKKAGFILHGKMKMNKINGDNNQYLYFFEKTQ